MRFDGMQLSAIISETTDPPTAMTWDSSGKLWIAYGKTLSFFDPIKNKPVPIKSDSLNHSVNDMLAVNENLWMATTGGGIVIRTKEKNIIINTSSGLSDDYVYCLEKDDAGNIWAGTDQGITVINSQHPFSVIKKISIGEGLSDAIVRRLKKSEGGKMWIGMQQAGIAVIQSGQKIFHITPSWKFGEVNDLTTDGNDLWVASEKGGLVFIPSDSTDRQQSFTQSATQNFLNVTAVAISNDGFTWFASDGRIYKTAGMKWTWLKSFDGKPLKNIHAVFADSKNNLWFTPDSGLMVFSSTQSIRHLSLPGIHSNTDITCFYEDECENVWIGTVGSGLFRFEKRTGRIEKVVLPKDEAAFQNIISLNGKANTLWIATFGGVFKTSTGSCNEKNRQLIIEPIETGQRIGNFYVYQVFVDSKNKIWFATDGNGLICYDVGKVVQHDVRSFSKENVVYSIAEDKKGNLWLSVHNGGLIRYDGKHFRQFTEKDGLKSNALQSVIHDGKNRLVLTYENGVDFFNTETEFVYSPGKEFGFETIKPDLNAMAHDKSGNIWIGTSQGIIRLSSDYSPENIKPQAVLCHAGLPGSTKFIANGEMLDHNENLISLVFCGFWNAAPEQLLYRYKFKNSDAWITTIDRQIVLSGLNPGSYEITFQASHNLLFLSPAESTFQFTICKPLWKRTWFLALLAFAMAAFIFSFIRLRENQLRKMEILQKEKTIYQYETLKSQVNPHFLFNSLNTLISVIETESREEASHFAQQLSDFFRSSLSLREMDFITLKEEADMAQAFIQILEKRFGTRVEIQTRIGKPDLEKKILPMSLQMLIENALKHNAATEEQPLKINIYSEYGYVLVTNNINLKKIPEASTQTGLQNIINRYRHYGREDVEVINNGTVFTVKLPLLNIA